MRSCVAMSTCNTLPEDLVNEAIPVILHGQCSTPRAHGGAPAPAPLQTKRAGPGVLGHPASSGR
ncbi:hypothetical protein STRIP9103_04567 [Streptomyces ipomoeae 91-03]|uniref:Uncharacterized protein n=1 Tax=Streptomyces ipomoeae 91-03 TaxID=698759 RepID=L1L0G3_9ACTN|nr:hypothetical protein STRIP9103_04567 [Streptomyces ipomoeae 91-03]